MISSMMTEPNGGSLLGRRRGLRRGLGLFIIALSVFATGTPVRAAMPAVSGGHDSLARRTPRRRGTSPRATPDPGSRSTSPSSTLRPRRSRQRSPTSSTAEEARARASPSRRPRASPSTSTRSWVRTGRSPSRSPPRPRSSSSARCTSRPRWPPALSTAATTSSGEGALPVLILR